MTIPAETPARAVQEVGEIIGYGVLGFQTVPIIYWAEGYWPAEKTKLYAIAEPVVGADPCRTGG